MNEEDAQSLMRFKLKEAIQYRREKEAYASLQKTKEEEVRGTVRVVLVIVAIYACAVASVFVSARFFTFKWLYEWHKRESSSSSPSPLYDVRPLDLVLCVNYNTRYKWYKKMVGGTSLSKGQAVFVLTMIHEFCCQKEAISLLCLSGKRADLGGDANLWGGKGWLKSLSNFKDASNPWRCLASVWRGEEDFQACNSIRCAKKAMGKKGASAELLIKTNRLAALYDEGGLVGMALRNVKETDAVWTVLTEIFQAKVRFKANCPWVEGQMITAGIEKVGTSSMAAYVGKAGLETLAKKVAARAAAEAATAAVNVAATSAEAGGEALGAMSGLGGALAIPWVAPLVTAVMVGLLIFSVVNLFIPPPPPPPCPKVEIDEKGHTQKPTDCG